MKVKLVIFVILTLSIVSCKKSKKVTVPERTYVQWYPYKLMPVRGALFAPGYPSYSNVWGVMISCSISAQLIDTAGKEKHYSGNWAEAFFLNSSGKHSVNSNAGDITLNGTAINFDTFYEAYRIYDSADLWHPGTSNSWKVSGGADVSPFTADVDVASPQFTGTLPAVVSRSKDLSLTFDHVNTANTDSVGFVLYYEGDLHAANPVSALGGTASIPAATIKRITTKYTPLDFYFSCNGVLFPQDSSLFSDGVILLALFHQTKKTFGGKDFVFIRQTQIIRSVKITD